MGGVAPQTHALVFGLGAKRSYFAFDRGGQTGPPRAVDDTGAADDTGPADDTRSKVHLLRLQTAVLSFLTAQFCHQFDKQIATRRFVCPKIIKIRAILAMAIFT